MKKHVYLGTAFVVALCALGAGCSSSSTSTNTTSNTNQAVANVNTNTTDTTNTAAFNAKANNSAILSDAYGQWANGATASTQYGSEDWSAKQATNTPDVTEYGDDSNAWAPAEKNKGTETLELTYAKAVYVNGVRIRESSGSGAVSAVELKDIDGNYHSIWSGIDTTKELNYFQIPVTTTTYKVNGVRITFDTTLLPEDWVEVDAVQLVGK
ncbi:MAG: hypothetical protein A2233_02775 [Candidatus Kerfeldbacteria bacterium RIFOXYA2_FULL_38_24]|uniref:Pappalysin-1 SD scarf domain-containing protein n=1 Tax=Candidatus Kerfeldbacteria bacterium RIFOXYB2_FULL_38_14 TaxID=1798547 RepID=A0A1G2BEK5_9BACT|nr:MAG: hypothetical protein A2233_02775 [Candidatus Kerfeldbacteria bacterium RIFOXYA2_FULL_38_24]OGY87106.1 MAG: hypothetical protein A2319_02785 [Candidatus Kerfeldbacteria bacterium RIFOXYB2_FULL_38_14]OGY88523.1 MAG: hypothetical protein A2458_05215 [Candidatus Kerfeldbacteria bacterium RIFOXYC2_FULL_38_9]